MTEYTPRLSEHLIMKRSRTNLLFYPRDEEVAELSDTLENSRDGDGPFTERLQAALADPRTRLFRFQKYRRGRCGGAIGESEGEKGGGILEGGHSG